MNAYEFVLHVSQACRGEGGGLDCWTQYMGEGYVGMCWHVVTIMCCIQPYFHGISMNQSLIPIVSMHPHLFPAHRILDPSLTIHEIGHTLGAGHSRILGSSNQYDDLSSVMGYGPAVRVMVCMVGLAAHCMWCTRCA